MSTTKRLRQQARRQGQSVGYVFFHAAQCGFCPLCSERLDLKSEKLSFDHVFPLNGGVNIHNGNLLLAHRSCNQNKSNTPPSRAEVHILQMVNAVLGFDEASGEYARKHSIACALEKERTAIVARIQELREKERTNERQIPLLQKFALQKAEQELVLVDGLIEDQYSVLNTYELCYE